MPVEMINPDGVFKPTTYSQVAIARGTRTLYLSGQTSLDEHGNIVGKGDLAAQSAQVFLNIAAALRAVGGTFRDVAKLTMYVPDWESSKMEALINGAMSVAAKTGFDGKQPVTLIGVAALASPDLLLEIEAIAVMDD